MKGVCDGRNQGPWHTPRLATPRLCFHRLPRPCARRRRLATLPQAAAAPSSTNGSSEQQQQQQQEQPAPLLPAAAAPEVLQEPAAKPPRQHTEAVTGASSGPLPTTPSSTAVSSQPVQAPAPPKPADTDVGQRGTVVPAPAVRRPAPQRRQPQQFAPPSGPGFGTFWGLLVLSLAYLHHSTTGFALPSLLPIITDDLHLSDSQGALLTVGYTVLYALALVPVGLLADRVDRPRLLSLGIALWSLLTMSASQAQGFGQLLAMRVGFATAQATQNPICFSLIPELFPAGKTTAMAVYNSAIYAGRALSFAAVIIAAQLGVPELQGRIGDIGYSLVPLDKVDLSLVSVLYIQGDLAAITPVYTYAIPGEDGEVPTDSPFAGWRQLLAWLGPPGMVLAVLCLLTVDEPRTAAQGGFLGDPLKSSRFLVGTTSGKDNRGKGKGGSSSRSSSSSSSSKGFGNRAGGTASAQQQRGSGGLAATGAGAGAPARVQAVGNDTAGSIGDSLAKLRILLASPKFQAITFASAINDVGSWALVSWQATFYQRVFHLSPDVYAPLLAVVIPIGGIIGGVGAGVFGDWLSRRGARWWLTAVGNIVAAPIIALSLLAPDYRQSFAALLVGFALSEAWRAPAAVMVREISPPGLGSTGSAVHLCIRNLVGGLGPIGVALLAGKVGLQAAILLVPGCYLLSGLGFVAAELVLKQDRDQHQLAGGRKADGKA